MGNEFFDALPIKQFKKINNILYEKYVKLEENSEISTIYKKADSKIIMELKKYDLLKNQSFIEFPKQGLAELNLIINTIKKLNGGLLLIDYGFLKQQSKNTLQSIRNHKQNMIFENIGDADITSLVNFNLLESYFNTKFFFKKNGNH